MTSDDALLARYRGVLAAHTERVATSDADDRHDAALELQNVIIDLVGSEDEWDHAGSHYSVWATINDLMSSSDDPVAFDREAQKAAATWLALPHDEAAHVAWLAARDAWMSEYARAHPRLR